MTRKPNPAPSALPRLERILLARLGREILRRFLLWLALASSAWFLSSAVFMLAAPPEALPTAILLALLSLMPAFLFLPGKGGFLLEALRAEDRNSTFEAFLETRGMESPEAVLIARKALEADRALPQAAKTGRAAVRGLLPFFLAAALSLAMFETASLIVLKRPSLAYRPPEEARGSGMRMEEKSLYYEDQGTKPPPPPEDSEKGGKKAEGQAETGLSPAFLREDHVERSMRAEKADAIAEIPAEEDGEGVGRPPDAVSGGKKGEERPAGEGRGSEAGEAGGEEEGEEGARKGPPSSRGYEGSSSSPAPSPLLDYRARLFSALTESGNARDFSSGTEMDATRLEDYERAFFLSFSIDAGLAPREDAYSMMIKRRWAEAGGRR